MWASTAQTAIVVTMKNGIKNLERCPSTILDVFSLDLKMYSLSTFTILSYVSVTKFSSMLHYLNVPNSKMAHLLRRVQIDLWALTIL